MFSKGSEERRGGTLFAYAHSVDRERGTFTSVYSGDILTLPGIISTEFTYAINTLRIESATIFSNVLRLEIKVPKESTEIAVESSQEVSGVYSNVQHVEYSQSVAEIIYAFVPIHDQNRFYRARREGID